MHFLMRHGSRITGSGYQHFEAKALRLDGSRIEVHYVLEDKVQGSGIRHEESDVQGSVTKAHCASDASTSILHQIFL